MALWLLYDIVYEVPFGSWEVCWVKYQPILHLGCRFAPTLSWSLFREDLLVYTGPPGCRICIDFPSFGAPRPMEAGAEFVRPTDWCLGSIGLSLRGRISCPRVSPKAAPPSIRCLRRLGPSEVADGIARTADGAAATFSANKCSHLSSILSLARHNH